VVEVVVAIAAAVVVVRSGGDGHGVHMALGRHKNNQAIA